MGVIIACVICLLVGGLFGMAIAAMCMSAHMADESIAKMFEEKENNDG